MFRVIELSWRDYVRGIARPVVIALSMGVPVLVARLLLPQQMADAELLGILIAVGGTSYMALVSLFERDYLRSLWSLLLPQKPGASWTPGPSAQGAYDGGPSLRVATNSHSE